MTTVSRYSLYVSRMVQAGLLVSRYSLYVYALSHGTGWVVMTTVSRYSLYIRVYALSLMVQAGLL